MKKNKTYGLMDDIGLLKMIKMMRFTIFILFLSLSQTFAVNSYSQETKLTFDMRNARVEDIIDRIEKNSEFFFMYNKNMIDIDRKVDLKVEEKNINQVLDKLFENTEISYSIKDRQILLINRRMMAGIGDETVSQQQKSISGKVTDSSGVPLPGVSVVVKGTTVGTITDANGNYYLSNVTSGAPLVFSFVGMKTQEIAIGGKTTINVVLAEEMIGLEEVVTVGYGTQKKATVTGSVASVKGEQLTVAPVASTTNTLAGRLPGLVSLQSSGQPGADAAAISIRGFGDALVIVDGVESSFNNIDANEIESVSILKDGAASIYGARAGNGVILVTTKRGDNGKPVITLNSSYTMQGITAMPKPVNAGQYAELKSEEWLQSGKPADQVPYTPEQIQKYYDGTDPLYPNTNWYKVLVRDWAPQQQHNLSVRGGSDKIKYYGFLGYLDQGTVWKKNGGEYSRYNLQSNMDAKITDQLSLQLDLASTYEVRRFPWRGTGAFTDFWGTLPIYPATLPDPTKVSYANGFGTGGAHIVTNSDISGYNNSDDQTMKGIVALNYNIKAIKGLSAKALVNYLQDYFSFKYFTKPVKFYTYDPVSKIYSLAGSLGSNAALSESKSQSRTITGQFSLNYDHVFAENHHINMLFLYEAIDYNNDFVSANRVNFLTPSIDQLFAGSTTGMSNDGSTAEMGRKSYVGRLNYSFSNKYLIETSFRADASAKFPKNKRWGYFPSISAGWIISKERFMEGIKNLDNLKIRASYGESGNDGVGNFQYLSGYVYGGTYVLGNGAQQGLVSTGLANPDLTWEKMKISNVGADFSFWNRKLYGELDAFYRERKGIPATRITTLPSTFGAGLPPENINSLNNRGFELKTGTSGSTKDISWDVSANISWSRAKWDHYEEPIYTDSIQAKIYTVSGRWTDRQYGYVSDGLFTSQAQIDALKFDEDGQGNKSLRPGDIRYKDINGDGKLDWKDQVEIGKGTVPHWMIGFNINLKYKNFDLSALFQGAMGYYTGILFPAGGAVYPVEVYNLRWTPTNNNPNALVPRLGGAATNGFPSDYYYKKAGYLRLKALSVGYNLPGKWMDQMKFKQMRIYVAGTNLITFDKLKKYHVDPEAPSYMSGLYYPQQRTITFGINLSF